MRGARGQAAVAAATLAAVAGLAAAPASGARHAPSTVTLKSPVPNTFKGRVDSPRNACVPGRTVKLFQRRLEGEVSLVSRAVSDRGGIWRIDLAGQLTGKFFAKVKHRQVGSLLCKGARSTAIHVRP